MADRARITHELKTWPEFFQATFNGRKKFELRRNDRDFRVGDELLLKEWDPEKRKGIQIPGHDEFGAYTGREVKVRVDYVMDSTMVDNILDVDRGLGCIIMSVSLIP